MSRMLLVALLLPVVALGCSSSDEGGEAEGEGAPTTRQAEQQSGSFAEVMNPGYRLVHATMSEFSKMDRLLWVKQSSDAFEEILKEVASYAGELAGELEELAEDDPVVDLDGSPLPEVVGQARKAIGESMKDEVGPFGEKSGAEMERTMLLVLDRALTESRYVVRELARRERSERRAAVLSDADTRLGELVRKVQRQLEARHYRTPDDEE